MKGGRERETKENQGGTGKGRKKGRRRGGGGKRDDVRERSALASSGSFASAHI